MHWDLKYYYCTLSKEQGGFHDVNHWLDVKEATLKRAVREEYFLGCYWVQIQTLSPYNFVHLKSLPVCALCYSETSEWHRDLSHDGAEQVV